MSRSKNRKEKIQPLKVSENQTNLKKSDILKTPLGLYKCLETKLLNFPYGTVNFQEGQVLLMPHQIPIKKKFVQPLDGLFHPVNENTDLTNKNILVYRYGGIGDILCTLPGIYELKKKFKNITIGMMSSFTYLPILENFQGIIDGGVNNIVIYDSIKQFTHLISLDNVIETVEHPYDNIHEVYASKMFMKINDNTISEVISKNSAVISDSSKRKGIGIQYSSNAPIRNYNIDKLIETINLIAEKYPNELIYLLGVPNDYLSVNYIQSKTNGRVIPNGCGHQVLDVNQSFKLVGTLKCVIAPDSSMIHCAAFNKTPFVGLYGAFDAQSRIKHYKNGISLYGETDCSPCARHQPLNWCPYTLGEGPCINSISPQQIVESVATIMDLYQ